jgi:tRNA U38,U39,U40 pseudouridine synthase TruA
MCRFVVGIIVAAGYGKVSLESIHSALQTGSWEGSNLKPNFECAPSHGLVLYNVEYPEALSPKWQE